jgi:hypothetical protein
VWARLFDAEPGATVALARTATWRTLGRLEERGLLRRPRHGRGTRTIAVTLLREDGSGDPYTRPDGSDVPDRYLRIPTAFWKRAFDSRTTLPGLAMLLVIAKEKPWSSFPPDRMDEWYGWSGDTTQRGLKDLLDLGLVERRESFKKSPLSPTGSTLVYQYRLAQWMRPKAVPHVDKWEERRKGTAGGRRRLHNGHNRRRDDHGVGRRVRGSGLSSAIRSHSVTHQARPLTHGRGLTCVNDRRADRI